MELMIVFGILLVISFAICAPAIAAKFPDTKN